ncbi:MAG: YCF48-related protein [Planctomycetia bacterium]|nr:YCF48-related protein [Planctomycetia bacterium]
MMGSFQKNVFAFLCNKKITIFFLIFFMEGSLLYDLSSLHAQGWKMYVDEIKKESAGKKAGNKDPFLPDRREDPGPAPHKNSSARSPENKRSGIRGTLGFDQILGSDYRTDSANPSPEIPDADKDRQSRPKAIPSCRALTAMRNSASLNDLFFTDPLHGWVVGDRGTLWTTSDGGIHWNLVPLPVDADLYSVHFINPDLGMIAGGSLLSSTQNGQGTILRTEDGGKSWKIIEHHSFPILRKVCFRDPANVLIAGDSSELYPGGLFHSTDSGKTWTADTGNRNAGIADFCRAPGMDNTIGLTNNGSILSIKGSRRETISIPVGQYRLRDLSAGNSNAPIRMVGEAGMMLQSNDGGISWSRFSGNLGADLLHRFDLNTLFAYGPYIWTGGEPGSLIFYSQDGGSSWNSAFTGVRTPVRRIFFTDPQNGWAVGDLGTILASRDGGRSWSVQREGGKRLAFLALWGKGTNLPWDAFVQSAGEEGYLGRVHLLVRENNPKDLCDEIPLSLRIREAVLESGMDGLSESSAFHLDSDQYGLDPKKIMDLFNRDNDGKGLNKLREYLVRLLRIWRPSVLMIEDGNTDSISWILERELPLAIQQAADPLAYPEHFTLCRLDPWKTERVYRRKNPLGSGPRSLSDLASRESTPEKYDLKLDTSLFCPSLGRSVGEIARTARGFLIDRSPLVPKALYFEKVYSQKENAGSGFFDSLNIEYGSEARRIPQTELLSQREKLIQRASERRKILGITESLAQRQKESPRGEKYLLTAEIANLIGNPDPDLAVEALLTLGKEFWQYGDWLSAEEIYSLIPLKYPYCSSGRESLIWLVGFYSSREIFWRLQDKNRAVSAKIKVDPDHPAQSNQSRLAVDPSRTDNRLQNAQDLGKMIRELYPELYMDPRIRFPLAAARREQGFTQEAMKYYLNRSLISKDDLWGIRAKAEYWLLDPNRQALSPEEQICPLGSLSCRAVTKKPYLDGKFEPEIWSSAERVSLSAKRLKMPSENPEKKKDPLWMEENRKCTSEMGSFISFLYDKEYLYIGIECKKAAGIDYKKDNRPRERDFDLSSFDRIEIQIDADRDYTSAWKFVFDYRGWAQESLWDDYNWNPKMFIANREDSTNWYLEIAISWEELIDRIPNSADVWNIAIRRIVPGIGQECWNADYSMKGENGFGFLTFGF